MLFLTGNEYKCKFNSKNNQQSQFLPHMLKLTCQILIHLEGHLIEVTLF